MRATRQLSSLSATLIIAILVLSFALVPRCSGQQATQEPTPWTTSPSYETVAKDNQSTALAIEDDDHLQHIFYDESYAVLIIQGAYQHPGWSKVSGPGKHNEQLLRESLEKRGFHVLIWRDLTGAKLRTTLSEAFGNLGYRPNTRLFFYYYGHGQVMGSDDEPSGPRTFLVPIDAPNPYSEEEAFYRVALPLSQIVEYSNQITVKHAFFALEACQAGSIVGCLLYTSPSPRD